LLPAPDDAVKLYKEGKRIAHIVKTLGIGRAVMTSSHAISSTHSSRAQNWGVKGERRIGRAVCLQPQLQRHQHTAKIGVNYRFY
jgi:hypothetical protein